MRWINKFLYCDGSHFSTNCIQFPLLMLASLLSYVSPVWEVGLIVCITACRSHAVGIVYAAVACSCDVTGYEGSYYRFLHVIVCVDRWWHGKWVFNCTAYCLDGNLKWHILTFCQDIIWHKFTEVRVQSPSLRRRINCNITCKVSLNQLWYYS